MSRAEELEALIKEQRAEMKLGSYQPLERFVAFSLDKLNTPRIMGDSSETWDTFVTTFDETTGSLHVPVGRSSGMCAIHGNREITVKKRGDWYCRICERDRNRLRRARYGAKTRRPCIHGDEFRYTQASGKVRCRACRKVSANRYNAKRRAPSPGLIS